MVLTNLVRSRWPNIEEIVFVQSLKSRRIFNYHSLQRTHWVSTEFLLRDQRGKSRRARRAYSAHLVSQSKQSIRFNLRMSARGVGCLIKVHILTDAFVGRSVAWWRRSWADFIWFRWDIISPTLIIKNASGDPSTFCWTPLAQTPYLSWAQLNRPFAKLGHMLGYHLATALWMTSHPRVHSDHKAFSPIKQSILSLIILLKN